uniref:P2RX7_C domain-containing protein n=1 Tax=Elaeophora elaphi TaxID=1147741 RepID=A0A158Q6Y1_9BILA
MEEVRIERLRAQNQLRISQRITATNCELVFRMVFSDVEKRVTERKNYILSCHLEEGRVNDVGNFCTCGHCKPVEHIPPCYAFCCQEAGNVVQEAGNENSKHAKRLAQKMANLKCITEHASFASICLDKEVLNMLAEHPGICANWLGNVLTFTNREYRYLAYRSFSWWIHGTESKGNRMDPPLCVLSKIVEKYPFEETVPTYYPHLLRLFGSSFFEEYEEGDDMWNYIDSQYPQEQDID